MNQRSEKPIWISHRGIRDTGLTENTLGAYELAVSRGFRWLETDLRLTKDRHIILAHDPDLKRLTKKDHQIHDLTRAELSALKLACGQGFLFLDEFLRSFAELHWVFDVKIETSAECLKALRVMIDSLPTSTTLESKITFLLWSATDEVLARSLFPLAKFFAQDNECWRAGLSAILGLGFLAGLKENRSYAVTPTLRGMNLFRRDIFDFYHRRGASVIAYLPSTPEQARMAVQAGADYILSDSLIFGQTAP